MTPEYHHGSLRAALVGAAIVQVRAVGADKVSLRGLAGTLGVSPSAAYAHFPDKDALLIAVGQRGAEELSRWMAESVDAVRGDDDAAAIAKLQATGVAYVGFALAEPHLFRLMFGPLCRKPTAPDGSPEPGSPYGLLHDHLAEVERRGLLRAPVDEPLRLMIWSVVHGFAALAIEGQVDVTAGLGLFDTLRRLLLDAPQP